MMASDLVPNASDGAERGIASTRAVCAGGARERREGARVRTARTTSQSRVRRAKRSTHMSTSMGMTWTLH